MRIYPAGFKEEKQSGSQWAWLYHLTLKNGTDRFYTDAQQDITVDGITYYCGAKIKRSAISFAAGLETSNLDVTMLYKTGFVTKEDIKSGLFNGGSFEINEIIVSKPYLGLLPILSGYIGEQSIGRIQTTTTFHSLTDILNTKKARVTTPTCPWNVGDMTPGHCMKDITPFIKSMAISAVSPDKSSITISTSTFTPNSDVFNYGKVRFKSGLNAGLTFSIKNIVVSSGSTIINLKFTPPYDVLIGDDVDVYPGCTKLLSRCQSDYGNGVNFGGQPFVPGEIKVVNGLQ